MDEKQLIDQVQDERVETENLTEKHDLQDGQKNQVDKLQDEPIHPENQTQKLDFQDGQKNSDDQPQNEQISSEKPAQQPDLQDGQKNSDDQPQNEQISSEKPAQQPDLLDGQKNSDDQPQNEQINSEKPAQQPDLKDGQKNLDDQPQNEQISSKDLVHKLELQNSQKQQIDQSQKQLISSENLAQKPKLSDGQQKPIDQLLNESVQRENLTKNLDFNDNGLPIPIDVSAQEWEIINPHHHSLDISICVEAKLSFLIDFSLERLNHMMTTAQDIVNKYYDNENIVSRGVQLTKLCSIAGMQIHQVALILNNKPIIEQKINEVYDIKGTKETINQATFSILLNYLNDEILIPLRKVAQKLYESVEKGTLRQTVVLLSKMHSCLEQLPAALLVPKNDLLLLPRDHQDWVDLKECLIVKELDSQKNIEAAYNKLSEGLMLGNAMVSKGAEYKNEFTQQFMQGFGAVYYLFAKKQAKERAKHFMAEPTKDLAFKVWNMGEEGLMKALMPILFESITFNEKIYIPKRFLGITPEYIKDQMRNGMINKITNDVGNQIDVSSLPSLSQLQDSKKKEQGHVTVRILCYQNLQQQNPSTLNYLYQQTIKLIQGKYQFEQIIVHIHGGGFVSMSSRSHQTYTRKWANRLKIPIFSIDYRMAPNDPYPAGLDDIWQAYMFLISFIENYFNIKPKRVALVGDSAGGNLVASLSILTIKTGTRIPDGILMAYPALSLDIKKFTPSFLVALDDTLLHHTVLKLCLDSYILEGFSSTEDPLLSPSCVSDEILVRFPKTRIVVGTYDPLHDESFRLLQRMNKLKKDVKLIEYKWMPHGFLSFDVIQGMPQSATTVADANEILRELVQ